MLVKTHCSLKRMSSCLLITAALWIGSNSAVSNAQDAKPWISIKDWNTILVESKDTILYGKWKATVKRYVATSGGLTYQMRIYEHVENRKRGGPVRVFNVEVFDESGVRVDSVENIWALGKFATDSKPLPSGPSRPYPGAISYLDQQELNTNVHWALATNGNASFYLFTPISSRLVSMARIRTFLRTAQEHRKPDSRPYELVSRASEQQLRAAIFATLPQIEAEALVNLKWVAYHEGKKSQLKKALNLPKERRYKELRRIYDAKQWGEDSGKKRARNLLRAVSDGWLERSVAAL